MKRLRGKFTESIDRVEKDNIVIGSTQRWRRLSDVFLAGPYNQFSFFKL